MNKKSGFTIVELLVVIVVIGILASITIVSYTGITAKAKAAVIKSDLASNSKKLGMYYTIYGLYPTALDGNNCPTAPNADANYCLTKTNSSSTLNYAYNNNASTKMFSLVIADSSLSYKITESSTVSSYTSLAVTDPANWMQVGTQVWAKANSNVGTRINGTVAQTNNAVLEKYCYSDLESNCTTYGGLYQWDEAMQYVVTAGAQGICPSGSHIPTDNEIKILEMSLGMSQAQADTWGTHGTDQGTQLKTGGASGLNVPLAGNRGTDGLFYVLSGNAYLWSSTEAGASAYERYLQSDLTTIYRNTFAKGNGFSIRCLGN